MQRGREISDVEVDIDPETANRMMEVLNAFPSFKKKKPETEELPAHLRLNRKHLVRTKKWYKEAKESLTNPTYHGLNRTFSKSSKIFDVHKFFGDKKDDKEGDKEEEEEAEKEEEKSEDSDSDWSDNDSDLDDDFFGFFGGGENPSFTQGAKNMFAENVPRFFTDFVADAQPLMAKMMSKNMMYPQQKAAREKLSEWIEKNRGTNVSEGEIKLREEQLEILNNIMELWEEEKEDDDEDVKTDRKEAIVQLGQELEKKGKLPPEVEAAVNEEISANGKPTMQHDDLTGMMDTFMDFGTNMMSNLFTGSQGSAVPGQSAAPGQQNAFGDCTIL